MRIHVSFLCSFLISTCFALAQTEPNLPANGDALRKLQRAQDSVVSPKLLPYVLDQARYKRELNFADDARQKLEILSHRWSDVALAVLYCDVVTGPATFHRSVRFWKSNYLETRTWTIDTDGDFVAPQTPQGNSSIRIKGNCRADVTLTGLIHIYGDLAAKLTVSDQTEVVIGGDVSPSGVIETDGIADLFVGGDVKGEIRNKGSAMIWIHGNLDADISAGSPIISLHVMEDFHGNLKPPAQPVIADLDVRGSMNSEKIRSIALKGWTQFHASIGISDVLPGLYPTEQVLNAYWVVHSTNQQ